MNSLITDSVRRRIAQIGGVPDPHDVYDRRGAGVYEILVGPDRSEVRELLSIARRTGPDVLDLGCGGGRLTVPLLRAGKRVTALDSSRAMLDELRRAAGSPDHLATVEADMTCFTLDRRFDLIVLGATSITLLDPAQRRDLYAAVRRHLAPNGAFALSVGEAPAVERLRDTTDRIVAGTAPGRGFLFSQQIDDRGATRILNIVEEADLARPAQGARITVLTSLLHLVERDTVCRELENAGFDPIRVHPVRVHPAGSDDSTESVMLEARDAGSIVR